MLLNFADHFFRRLWRMISRPSVLGLTARFDFQFSAFFGLSHGDCGNLFVVIHADGRECYRSTLLAFFRSPDHARFPGPPIFCGPLPAFFSQTSPPFFFQLLLQTKPLIQFDPRVTHA